MSYTCEGSVRGQCGVTHRTLERAVRCCQQDGEGCASQGQGCYSDRQPVRVTREGYLEPLSEREEEERAGIEDSLAREAEERADDEYQRTL